MFILQNLVILVFLSISCLYAQENCSVNSWTIRANINGVEQDGRPLALQITWWHTALARDSFAIIDLKTHEETQFWTTSQNRHLVQFGAPRLLAKHHLQETIAGPLILDDLSRMGLYLSPCDSIKKPTQQILPGPRHAQRKVQLIGSLQGSALPERIDLSDRYGRRATLILEPADALVPSKAKQEVLRQAEASVLLAPSEESSLD